MGTLKLHRGFIIVIKIDGIPLDVSIMKLVKACCLLNA